MVERGKDVPRKKQIEVTLGLVRHTLTALEESESRAEEIVQDSQDPRLKDTIGRLTELHHQSVVGLLFNWLPNNVISIDTGRVVISRPDKEVIFIKTLERKAWSLQDLDDWAANLAEANQIRYNQFFPPQEGNTE